MFSFLFLFKLMHILHNYSDCQSNAFFLCFLRIFHCSCNLCMTISFYDENNSYNLVKKSTSSLPYNRKNAPPDWEERSSLLIIFLTRKLTLSFDYIKCTPIPRTRQECTHSFQRPEPLLPAHRFL